MEFLHQQAQKGTVSSLEADWWGHILAKVPQRLREIVDPATEEDDVTRKKLQAKKDFYDDLAREVHEEYQHTLKQAMSLRFLLRSLIALTALTQCAIR